MILPLDAVREAVPREWTRFRSLLAAADGATWMAPTRLGAWTVRDLVVHAVWGTSMEADALRRRRTGSSGRAEGRSLDEGTEREQVLAALDVARQELAVEVAQLAEEDLDALAPLPYGDVPVVMFSQILVMEAGIHTDDLATALARPGGLAADVVAATEVFLRAFLPVVAASAAQTPEGEVALALRGASVALTFRYRDDSWEAPEPDEPLSPALTVEADDSAVLLFALGRIPHTDRRLSFSGDAALAGHFKAWLPGP